jgi:hypothetical protein
MYTVINMGICICHIYTFHNLCMCTDIQVGMLSYHHTACASTVMVFCHKRHDAHVDIHIGYEMLVEGRKLRPKGHREGEGVGEGEEGGKVLLSVTAKSMHLCVWAFCVAAPCMCASTCHEQRKTAKKITIILSTIVLKLVKTNWW